MYRNGRRVIERQINIEIYSPFWNKQDAVEKFYKLKKKLVRKISKKA